jgi:dolichol-phosphate mannosyltransferase
MPYFSVILPCYNEVSNIGRLVGAIRNSGFSPQDCEIVIIDDNSTDGTSQLVSRLSDLDPGIQHIVTSNRQGLAKSIWIGINKSQGSYIAVLDSDGMHDPAYLPRMLEQAAKGNSLMIGSRFVLGGSSHGNVYPHISRFVNLVIQKILRSKVKDQLCGFFVCERKIILEMDESDFTGFGEYFISVIKFFERRSIPILEIGTIHKVRDGGLRKSRRIQMFFNYLSFAVRIR